MIRRPPRVGTGAWFPGRYYTKGSGGNGVNTVCFVDTTGHACPSGTGLPVAGAPLPTSPIVYNPALLQGELGPAPRCWFVYRKVPMCNDMYEGISWGHGRVG